MDSVSYSIVDVFVESPEHRFTGNPAAVVQQRAPLSDATMRLIAREFNLPMTAFVSEPTEASGGAYGLRWFLASGEFPLCGHATFASSHVLFSSSGSPSNSLKFQTLSGLLEATRLHDGRLELTLPVGTVHPAPADLSNKAITALHSALGGPVGDVVDSVHVGSGGAYDAYLIIRLRDSFDLPSARIDSTSFKVLAPRLHTILTRRSPDADAHFESRVFIPLVGIPEDEASGSSHSLLTRYWTRELGLDGQELVARPVGPRRGALRLQLDEKSNKVSVRGFTTTVARGEMFLKGLADQ